MTVDQFRNVRVAGAVDPKWIKARRLYVRKQLRQSYCYGNVALFGGRPRGLHGSVTGSRMTSTPSFHTAETRPSLTSWWTRSGLTPQRRASSATVSIACRTFPSTAYRRGATCLLVPDDECRREWTPFHVVRARCGATVVLSLGSVVPKHIAPREHWQFGFPVAPHLCDQRDRRQAGSRVVAQTGVVGQIMDRGAAQHVAAHNAGGPVVGQVYDRWAGQRRLRCALRPARQ